MRTAATIVVLTVLAGIASPGRCDNILPSTKVTTEPDPIQNDSFPIARSLEFWTVRAKAVARITTPESCGTGFMIDEVFMLTNAHVVLSDAGRLFRPNQYKAWFDYFDPDPEDDHTHAQDACTDRPDRTCGGTGDTWKIDTVFVLSTTDKLDVALIKFKKNAGKGPGHTDHFGTLPLRGWDVTKHEGVRLLHHPGGECKECAAGPWARVFGFSPDGDLPAGYFSHKAWNFSGSSGSPVLGPEGAVVGIVTKGEGVSGHPFERGWATLISRTEALIDRHNRANRNDRVSPTIMDAEEGKYVAIDLGTFYTDWDRHQLGPKFGLSDTGLVGFTDAVEGRTQAVFYDGCRRRQLKDARTRDGFSAVSDIEPKASSFAGWSKHRVQQGGAITEVPYFWSYPKMVTAGVKSPPGPGPITRLGGGLRAMAGVSNDLVNWNELTWVGFWRTPRGIHEAIAWHSDKKGTPSNFELKGPGTAEGSAFVRGHDVAQSKLVAGSWSIANRFKQVSEQPAIWYFNPTGGAGNRGEYVRIDVLFTQAIQGGRALGINDAGDAVGSVVTGDRRKAVLWKKKAEQNAWKNGTDLGVVQRNDPRAQSEALDINAAGDIVGWSGRYGDDQVAFVRRGDEMKDLNALLVNGRGLKLLTARAINDRGQILCDGTTRQGNQEAHHLFLLSPKWKSVEEGAGPAGDVNGDGLIDGHDLAVLLANLYREVEPYTTGDLTGDGVVGGEDVTILLDALADESVAPGPAQAR